MNTTGVRGAPRVLLVDDEPGVLLSLSELLRREFWVTSTTDVDEALAFLASEDVAVLLADQRMPKMTGVDLLGQAARLRPKTIRMLLTGYADIEAAIEAVNLGRVWFYLTKPWDSAALLALVSRAARLHGADVERGDQIGMLASLTDPTVDTPPADPEDPVASMERENRTLRAAYDQLKNSFWHLRKIEEVLPMCLNCGRVKTAEGTWEDVAAYLKANSKFLSHGYCPACAAEVSGRTRRHE